MYFRGLKPREWLSCRGFHHLTPAVIPSDVVLARSDERRDLMSHLRRCHKAGLPLFAPFKHWEERVTQHLVRRPQNLPRRPKPQIRNRSLSLGR